MDGHDIRLGGDVIVAVDNQSVRAMEDLLSYLEEQKVVGDNIDLSVVRDGKTQHIDMILAADRRRGLKPSCNQTKEQIRNNRDPLWE